MYIKYQEDKYSEGDTGQGAVGIQQVEREFEGTQGMMGEN